MDTTVRATCPKCRTVLRIPAEWVGQAVKCKKCGSVVRSKPRGGEGSPVSNGTAEAAPLDATTPSPSHQANGQPVPAGNAFDFSQPTAADDPFPLPEPFAQSAPEPAGFNPTGAADTPPQPAPMPGDPYPMPPGYPPPGTYAPPPGHPYAVPPGYPYPMPPGYPPPGAYAAPPGYPYQMPPGYGLPGVYAPPPGYPYALPPEMVPPGNANPPVPAQAPANSPAPLPNGPARPGGPAKPSAAAKPQGQVPGQAAPSSPRPLLLPDPIPSSSEFTTDSSSARVTTGRRYRRGNGKGKMIWIGVCLFMTAGLVAGGIFGAKYLPEMFGKKELPTDPTKLVELLGSGDAGERDAAQKALKQLGTKAESALRVGLKSANPEIAKQSGEVLGAILGTPVGPGGTVAKGGPFPRRLLFIHISKYMFLNPLTATAPGAPDRTKSAALRLAFEWRVPTDKDNNQLFVLSDTAPPDATMKEVQTPMKNVVTGAYERFFDTSRSQDRIVVYFGGHALEKDGKVYLAPVEGDLDEPEASLIPIEEFYGKLKACKATQKVVIWDVCRFNPDRGRQRPGSDPMNEVVAKALAAAPPGVEVVTTCQPGENALEFYSLQLEPTVNAPKYSGSAFLESMKYVAEKNRAGGKPPAPTDPIPVAEWAPAVGTRVNAMASSPIVSLKQTLKAEGKPPATQVAFNPDEPVAKRFDMPLAPKGTSIAEIKSIESEFTVPPIKPDLADAGLGDMPFKDEIMKDYKADVPIAEILKDKDKYKFRVATLDAFHAIRDLWVVGSSGGPEMRLEVKAPITDDVKKEINKDLEFWAIGIAKLELINIALDEVAPMKEGQPKRWQAHYEYARAVVKGRLAYMNEYNKLMGDVRTETLPPLDKMLGQNQYRLVSSEKMKSKKEVQKLAEEAQEAYTRLITEFKNTPWAIQAKRDKSFSLGLFWRPASSAKPTD